MIMGGVRRKLHNMGCAVERDRKRERHSVSLVCSDGQCCDDWRSLSLSPPVVLVRRMSLTTRVISMIGFGIF